MNVQSMKSNKKSRKGLGLIGGRLSRGIRNKKEIGNKPKKRPENEGK